MTSKPLPVLAIKNQLIDAIAHHSRVIITAPTGSGKSTQIPQLLRDDCALQGNILVLQPRRLAARMLATRVAEERGCHLGTEVGYITRFDSQHCGETRICFITEGILPRLLLKSRCIPDINAVVFDEFHERSIHSDVGLGLIRHLQETGRPDIRIVVMSATIDSAELGGYLGAHALLHCPQREHPVTIRYIQSAAQRTNVAVWNAAATALAQLLEGNPDGDVLIFMPGVYEIRKTIERCKVLTLTEPVRFLPLYGELCAQEQHEAMRTGSERRVIVATNIAETSLTIPGVRHVIDSGLARINRFDAGRGLNALRTEPISKDSAQQRTGRAGRLGPGICVRLWSEEEHRRRLNYHDPEIRRIDVAEVFLNLMNSGFEDPEHSFPWLLPPSTAAIGNARELLRLLGAVNPDGKLTPLGKAMANLPAHPRIARLLLEGKSRGCLTAATLVAGIVAERPIVLSDPAGRERFLNRFECDPSPQSTGTTGSITPHSDVLTWITALEFARANKFDGSRCGDAGIHTGAARQVWRTADYYRQRCDHPSRQKISRTSAAVENLIQALLLSFPDHLARRRDVTSRACFLRDGRRAELGSICGECRTNLLLPLEMREIGFGQGTPAVYLSLVSEIAEEWLIDLFPDAWTCEHVVEWNEAKQAVEQRSIDRCLGLIINETVSHKIAPEITGRLLAKMIREKKLPLRGWNNDVQYWIARVHWVREQFPERGLTQYDDETVGMILEELCYGERKLGAIQGKSLIPLVKNRLTHADQQFVDAMAPERIRLPGGRSMKIAYQPGQSPRGRARIQELYGLTATPTVANGKQKLLLEILGPNHRAVQITDDLTRFWETLYPQIRPALKRRYPKHEWR